MRTLSLVFCALMMLSHEMNFRHNGFATVGFADGHVKMVNADGAKSLRWKP